MANTSLPLRTAAEQERAKADAIFLSIGDGALTTDENGKISRVNRTAAELLGYTEQELVGKWYPRVIIARDDSGDAIQPIERNITQALLRGRPVSSHTIYVRQDGSLLPVAVTASPILLDNKPIGAVEVFRDITHEKKIEEAKDEFLSIVSHQLRTPLTAIRLFTEMLLAGQVGPLKAKQRDYLDKVAQSALRMIHLVGTTLNISRIELGRVRVEPIVANLYNFLQGIVEEARPLADARHIQLELLPQKGAAPQVGIDADLLGEVVHNLLTNAIRYSPVKTGLVRVALVQHADGYDISVHDNGVGVPEDAKPKLFSRFYRADNAIKAQGEGTGLGLYLVRMIIETAGGSVWFESKENEGSTFYVRIPPGGMQSKSGDKGLSR